MKRKPLPPLALAVVALLFERPMHPYEMAATLKERGKARSIKLRFGSLYTVIAMLEREGLIVPSGRERAGNRPERTIFALTKAGAARLQEEMAATLAVPSEEYPQFVAALSLIGTVSPESAARLLRRRAGSLAGWIAATHAAVAGAGRENVPDLFLIEEVYRLSVAETERRFVEDLADRIEKADLGGLSRWREIHETPRSFVEPPASA